MFNRLIVAAVVLVGGALAIQGGAIPWLGDLAGVGLGQFVQVVLVKLLGLLALGAIAVGVLFRLGGWRSEHHEHGHRLMLAGGVALVVVFLGGLGFLTSTLSMLGGMHLMGSH